MFGGAAWTLDAASGQYYLHNFLPEQPDLDWWNEDVRAAFDDISRFWFDRGVAGFRIDVAHALVKDRELRDNPPARPERPADVGAPRAAAEVQHGTARRPSTCTGAWRRVAREFDPERLLLGETYVLSLEELMTYIVPDGLQLCMNLAFLHAPFVARALADVVAPDGGADARRRDAGLARVEPRRPALRDALVRRRRACDSLRARRLLSLRGTCILYQGDEIGLEALPVPPGRERDMVGRDACRTPMVWRDEDGAGFTEPGVEPWLPIGSRDRNVADQRDDPDSILTLTRDLIALRKHRRLLHGAYERGRRPAGRLGVPPRGRRLRRAQPRRRRRESRRRRGRDRDRHGPCTRRRAVDRSTRATSARGGCRLGLDDASGGDSCKRSC